MSAFLADSYDIFGASDGNRTRILTLGRLHTATILRSLKTIFLPAPRVSSSLPAVDN